MHVSLQIFHKYILAKRGLSMMRPPAAYKKYAYPGCFL